MRKVTEQDLRMPEFRDANIDDLEFRADGKLVRKDRWEQGIRSIHNVLGMSPREDFEIADVVEAVEKLVAKIGTNGDGWIPWAGGECPIAHATDYQVAFRYGGVAGGDNAKQLRWNHTGGTGDIVAYRVLP